MRFLRTAAGSVAIATLLLAVGWSTWRSQPGTDRSDTDTRTALASRPPGPPPRYAASREPTQGTAEARLETLRTRWRGSSLRGTELDGAIVFDAAGRLRLDPELRRRFEHYLSLAGEFDLHELRLLMRDDTFRAHGSAAAAEVLAAFDRYLGLRAALHRTQLDASLDTRYAQIEQLRREWFGDDAQSLFGDEADYDAYTLARLALRDMANLDSAQRERELARLAAARPAAERSALAAATSVLLAEEQTRQFDQIGLGARQRHAERTELWGEAAAARLEVLDAERAEWNARLGAYGRERARLLANADLAEAARAQALDRLLAQSFSEHERRRVESLQAIGALPPGG